MHKTRKRVLISTAALASLAVIGVAVLSIVGGVFTDSKYMEPWLKTYANQYTDTRMKLISNGILAASGHNMQPWRIVLNKSNSKIFYLYVDTNKLTPEVDPRYRQTLVSQGTFLEYIKVAADHLGLKVNTDLFPNGTYNESNVVASMKTMPLAKITLLGTNPKNNSLYPYMFLADTNRGVYKPNPLSAAQVTALESIKSAPIVTTKIYMDKSDLTILGNIANAGTKIESGVHRISNESANVFRSNESQKNNYRYGFSVEGQGTTGLKKYLLQGALTIFPSFNDGAAAAKNDIKITQNAVSSTPAYAMISTTDNSRVSQVKAGMTYSRLVLTAHSLGLVMQPPSQVLEEYPEMSNQYRSIHDKYAPKGDTIQMFFRVGQPTKNFPVSMRQDVNSFIVK